MATLWSCIGASHGCNNKTNNNHYIKQWNPFALAVTFAIWTVLTLATVTVQGVAVYSNVDFLSNPNFEPVCSAQQEHFIESEGKESSLILEFNPGVLAEKKKSCTRILSAPTSYGFIVRLILPKIRRGHQQHPAADKTESKSKTSSGGSALNEMTTTLIEKFNATAMKSTQSRTCPLSIFSSLDPHTPQWRVDPCQLEDTAPEMEDPVRLFHGRVRIVWEHGHNTLNSKLMVTVLGKGDQCRDESKHTCLKIGDEPILCISKDLVCDGIRHCPYSNEYDSDEDYSMCWKRRRFGEPIPPAMESDIFEHFALEVFRNLFAFDVQQTMSESGSSTSTPLTPTTETMPLAVNASNNSTTLRKVEIKSMGDTNSTLMTTTVTNETMGNVTAKADNSTDLNGGGAGGHHRRNSTRMGLNSDLSKYGPWGYLMLGMLLCGGALLICGLWASASQHAANNERESALQNAALNGSSIEHQSSHGAPPNYEELDPPPAYSVLFPNQKAASSTTLNSMGAAPALTTTPVLPPLSPSAVVVVVETASSGSTQQQQQTSIQNTTRVQMETATTSAGGGGGSSQTTNTN